MTRRKTTHAGKAELAAKHLNGRLNCLIVTESRVLEKSSKKRLVTYWITKKLDH